MALLETQPYEKHSPSPRSPSHCICRQCAGQNDLYLWSPDWNEQRVIHASAMSLQAHSRDTGRERHRHWYNVSCSFHVLLWAFHYHSTVVKSFNLN